MPTRSARKSLKRPLDNTLSDDALSMPPAKQARYSKHRSSRHSQSSQSSQSSQLSQASQSSNLSNSRNSNNTGATGAFGPAGPVGPIGPFGAFAGAGGLRLPRGVLASRNFRAPEFQRGSIKSIKLSNWVTFDYVELDCSPGLNLIVGPNGAGKSSVAAAISLGLCGAPRDIGRGDRIGDFIKRGRDVANVEITLHNALKCKNGIDEFEDVTIKRTVRKESNIWRINGKVKNKNEVSDLIESLNIKVSNKCQFLAQDKVSEFARLTPIELLKETQKAIEDNTLYDLHKDLIKLSKNSAESLVPSIKNLRESLASDLREKEQLRGEMETFQRSQRLRHECDVLQAKKEHLKVEEARQDMENCSNDVNEGEQILKRKKSCLKPLQQQIKQLTKVRDASEQQRKVQQNKLASNSKKLKNITNKLEELAEATADCEQTIETHEKDAIRRKSKLKRVEKEIGTLSAELGNFGDLKLLQSERQKLTKEMKVVRNKEGSNKREVGRLQNARHQVQENIRRVEFNLQHEGNQAQRRVTQLLGSKPEHYSFYKWVQQNKHRFQGEVFGPVALHLEVRNNLHCMYLERAMGKPNLLAYVVSDKEDWLLLNDQASRLRGNNNNNKVSIKIIEQNARDQINRNNRCSAEKMQSCGVTGYLEELYDAPELVKLAMNNVSSLHLTGYSERDLNVRQLEGIMRQNRNQVDALSSLFMPTKVVSVKISEYGEKDPVTNYSPMFPFRSPLVVQFQDNSDKIAKMRSAVEAQNDKLKQIQEDMEKFAKLNQESVKRVNEIKEKLQTVNKDIGKIQKVASKLKRREKELEDLQQDLDVEAVRLENEQEIAKHNKTRVNCIVKYAGIVEENVGFFKEMNCCKLLTTKYDLELKNKQDQYDTIMSDNQELIKMIKKRRKTLKVLEQTYEAMKHVADSNYPKAKFVNEWKEEWIKDYNTLNQVEDGINNRMSNLKYTVVNEDNVERYKKVVNDISERKARLEANEKKFVENREKIDELDRQWKPQLQAKIAKISKRFSQFFRYFKAEGEVKLIEGDSYYRSHGGNNGADKRSSQGVGNWRKRMTQMSGNNSNNNNNNSNNSNESNEKNGKNGKEDELIVEELDLTVARYDDWTIDIMTKFRTGEHERWSKLSANSQSGGEKSITTMIYLLSLQEVTTVPFRVVDEINQGMDSVNERRIMNILNTTCIHDRHDNNTIPQYFVITPKLLPDLRYAPTTAVFTVFNGPYQMPQRFMNQWTQSFTQAMTQRHTQTTNNNNNNNNSNNNGDAFDEEEKGEE